jgi:hypothetical protein
LNDSSQWKATGQANQLVRWAAQLGLSAEVTRAPVEAVAVELAAEPVHRAVGQVLRPGWPVVELAPTECWASERLDSKQRLLAYCWVARSVTVEPEDFDSKPAAHRCYRVAKPVGMELLVAKLEAVETVGLPVSRLVVAEADRSAAKLAVAGLGSPASRLVAEVVDRPLSRPVVRQLADWVRLASLGSALVARPLAESRQAKQRLGSYPLGLYATGSRRALRKLSQGPQLRYR